MKRHVTLCQRRNADTDAESSTHCHQEDSDQGTNLPNSDSELDAAADGDGVADFRDELREMLARRPANMSDEDVQSVFSEFDMSDENDEGNGSPDSDGGEMDDEPHVTSWVFTLCLFFAALQTLFNVPDGCIVFILQFIALYLADLSRVAGSQLITGLSRAFPKTMYRFWKHLHVPYRDDKDIFKKYVVCTKCHTLYDYNDCLTFVEGTRISAKCQFRAFPNHRQVGRRRKCQETLLEEVRLPSGKTELQGKSFYCYRSLQRSLQKLVQRENYERDCELWRERRVDENFMTDVYDGSVWQSFIDNGFLSEPRRYGMMVNVDWFQPFQHTPYSVGAIYLINFNLPRAVRFMRQNVILVGLIPSNPEPPTNTFVKPMVDELSTAWADGFQMKSYESPDEEVTFKVALMCVGCDIPASRKLCGFLGHAATVGCSRCLKHFPGGFGEKNYGGFDLENWPLRTDEQHRAACDAIKDCRTQTEREQAERENGARYSVLLDLEYYSAIKMVTIDPMHNLFLGTAKLMIRIWRDEGLITDNAHIQRVVDSFLVPSDLGKIPYKIASNFASLTADQLKNWVLYFSLIALKGVLPQPHFECWRKFVLACRALCRRSIKRVNIDLAHGLLVSFCRKFEELYGSGRVTPNMHLHCHLSDCVRQYGPIYSFWLFSFERYNGILGAVPTNMKQVEVQMFRKFMRNIEVLHISIPETIRDQEHAKFIRAKLGSDQGNQRGAVHDTILPLDIAEFADVTKMATRHFSVVSDWSAHADAYKFYNVSNYTFEDDELRALFMMYRKCYPEALELEVLPSGTKTNHVKFLDRELFGSSSSRTRRSALVTAFWPNGDGQITDDFTVLDSTWPGRVLYYVRHTVIIDGSAKSHVLAHVEWYTEIDNRIRFSYGQPIEIWANNIFVQLGPASFIPIQRIKYKILECPVEVRNRKYVAVVPRLRYAF